MSNYKEEKKKKLIKDLPVKELYKEEERLSVYQGADRVVPASELKAELSLTDESIFKFKTGIKTLDRILDGVECGELIVLTGLTGEGKCLGEGTPVLMFDGSIKNVEDIKNGDLLMGVDSTPRVVSGLVSGEDVLYEVKQVKGDSYVVNSSHVLSLKKTGTNEVVNIPIEDYIKKSDGFKHLHKGWKTGVDFKESKVDIDPYFLGMWLGDGDSKSVRITNVDFEVEDFLRQYAKDLQLSLKVYTNNGKKATTLSVTNSFNTTKNSLQAVLRKNNLLNNKHIPESYKINSRDVRLNVLAGLIDSDGYVNHQGYVFVNKNKRLAEDVLFIARSLGLYAYIKPFKGKSQLGTIGLYYKVGISGDCSIVPVKIKRKKVSKRRQIKDVLKTGITVKKLGIGNYYGFELNKDKLFILGDFTVTHNTTAMMTLTNNMAEQGAKSCWFTLEVTPRQFLKKMASRTENLPEFFLPKENTENTLTWIEERIIESNVKYNTKVVFIDHLNAIFSLEQFKGNLSLEIGDMVAKIKDMAIKHNQIIFLVAHCKDPVDNKEPTKHSIRDSGMIIRLADTILGIWRIRNDAKPDDDRLREIREEDNQAKIRIWKNRREGKLGTFFMEHKNHYLTEITKESEVEKLAQELKF